jgi:hypothetical protein
VSGSRYLRPAACRRERVVVRIRGRAVVYRRRTALLAVAMLVLVAAAVTAGLLTGYVVAGAGAVGLLLVAWLVSVLRVVRPLPAGPWGGGDGPAPPGGASMREPRRPLPRSPSGAAAMPLDPEEPPGRAVALA